NMRPKPTTVSTQFDRFSPSRSNMGMQMVADHRIAADLDAEEPCQLAQPIKNSLFAVTVILPGTRVHTAEKSPADASGDAMVNADPFFVDNLAARAGRHR